MIYLKKEINGKEVRIDIYDDEFFYTCLDCGEEFQLDVMEVAEIIKDGGDFAGTSIVCPECTVKRKSRKPEPAKVYALVRVK